MFVCVYDRKQGEKQAGKMQKRKTENRKMQLISLNVGIGFYRSRIVLHERRVVLAGARQRRSGRSACLSAKMYDVVELNWRSSLNKNRSFSAATRFVKGRRNGKERDDKEKTRERERERRTKDI
jgi:hypothetical protein